MLELWISLTSGLKQLGLIRRKSWSYSPDSSKSCSVTPDSRSRLKVPVHLMALPAALAPLAIHLTTFEAILAVLRNKKHK